MNTVPDLRANGITKRFGSFTAVNDVSLHLPPGSFHALLGENGAGKSTLVKCLMGFYHADAGSIQLGGKSVEIGSPREARSRGLGMVFQHFTLIPSMTVAENLVLARPDLPFIIDWKTENAKLKDFIDTAPFQVSLERRINTLSAGEKQKVEILKELYLHTKLLILDEPTSVLTAAEADEVLGFLHRLTEMKQLSVLLITHKFKEVMAYCREVSILRRGQLTGSGAVDDLSPAKMAEMMMGEARVEYSVAKTAPPSKVTMLQIEDLHAIGANGLEAVCGIDLTVHQGEIVGIAGVSGNGQRELVEVLGGQRDASAGRITVNGRVHRTDRASLEQNRFFTLPEEPLQNASVPSMTVAENMALRVFDRPPFQRAGFLLDRSAIEEFGRKLIGQFSVSPSNPNSAIRDLSGGNVQRAILARDLSSSDLQVLVAANPCFGLDFKAVDFIHNLLVEARNNGTAVLLISEDLDELLTLADRVFVISEGKLVFETVPVEADLAEIGRRMAGHH